MTPGRPLAVETTDSRKGVKGGGCGGRTLGENRFDRGASEPTRTKREKEKGPAAAPIRPEKERSDPDAVAPAAADLRPIDLRRPLSQTRATASGSSRPDQDHKQRRRYLVRSSRGRRRFSRRPRGSASLLSSRGLSLFRPDLRPELAGSSLYSIRICSGFPSGSSFFPLGEPLSLLFPGRIGPVFSSGKAFFS